MEASLTCPPTVIRELNPLPPLKIIVIRCQILWLNYRKSVFGWCSTSDYTGGAHCAPPDPPTAGFEEGSGCGVFKGGGTERFPARPLARRENFWNSLGCDFTLLCKQREMWSIDSV